MPPTHPAERWIHLTLDFVLRLGDVLMSSGAGAADVKYTMLLVAEKLGISRPEIDVTFVSLTVSYQPVAENPPYQAMRQVKHRELDYRGLTKVDQLVTYILSGQVDLREARIRLTRIVHAQRSTPRWAITLAWALMCAAVGLQIGGGWLIVVIAAVSAAVVDLIKLRMKRYPDFYQQTFAGAAATLIAVGAVSLANSTSFVDRYVFPSQAITVAIFMLLAGVGFMGAIQDALTGFYITAGARLIEAILATAGILAGVGAGLTLARILGLPVSDFDPNSSPLTPHVVLESIPLTAVSAAFVAAAFAFACYAPRRSLAGIAGIALISITLHQLLMYVGVGRPWAAGTGAFVVGLLAHMLSRRIGVPELVLVVPSVIPMLPGLLIFRGLALMTAGGMSETSFGMLAMITAGSVAVSLAAGVLLGQYVAQPVERGSRFVNQRVAVPHLIGARFSRLGRRRTARLEEEPRRDH